MKELNLSRVDLLKYKLNQNNSNIEESIKRLDSGEAIEYIINSAEFYSLDFYVDSNVLIPRNETELLVDIAIDLLSRSNLKFDLVDVWTGSSCIIISILKNLHNIDIIDKKYAIDICSNALKTSKINIDKFNQDIIQIEWSLLNPIVNNINCFNKNLFIVSNLPYIKNNDYNNMSLSTIKYEPSLALYWWKDSGFELYEDLILQCVFLSKYHFNIVLLIEIWFDQYDYSYNFLKNLWLSFVYFKDNLGFYRSIKINFDLAY